MTIRHVRLQLSRVKGFNLQRLSMETNGLACVNVARPGKWGNPFATDGEMFTMLSGLPALKVKRRAIFAADLFRMWLNCELEFDGRKDSAGIAAESWVSMCKRRTWMLAELHQLAGKNAACFCKPLMSCHADVLLELANT